MIRRIATLSIAACIFLPAFAIAQTLPDAANLLGLSEVKVREKPRAEYGRDLIGNLPGGAVVKVELDADNRVEEVEARRGAFPIAGIEALVPEAVRANAQWPKEAMLNKIEFERDGRIEIDGRLASGQEFDARFSADGQLIDFDTDG